jgi:hypothetical protein
MTSITSDLETVRSIDNCPPGNAGQRRVATNKLMTGEARQQS